MNTEPSWEKVTGKQYPNRTEGYEGPLCAHGGKAEGCHLSSTLGPDGEKISSNDLLLVFPAPRGEQEVYLIVKGTSLNPKGEVEAYLFQSNAKSSEPKQPLSFSSLAELAQYLSDIGLPVPSQIVQIRSRVAEVMEGTVSTGDQT